MRKFAISLLVGSLVFAPLTPVFAAAGAPVTFVRRAEAVMILLKNSGVKVDLNTTMGSAYPDILDGQWYVPYIAEGLKRGLISVEESTGLIYPHRSVTRAEFLKMLTQAFGLTTDIPYQYTDVKSGDPVSAYAGLSWRYKLLGSTVNPNLLQPDMRITHAEAARTIVQLFDEEPSLRPEPNFVPAGIAVESVNTVDQRRSFFSDINSTIYNATESIVNTVTPTTVKSAVLTLIRSRGNLAEQTRNDLIAAVNDVRAEYNLQPLKSNYYLEISAQNHAKDMADRGYFSHYTPEGLSYVDRIRKAGYLNVNPNACSCAQQFDLGGSVADKGPGFIITGNEQCSCEPTFSLGENLAKGQLSVQQVLDDWMNSPGHRKNILRPEFEEIGIGLFEDVWSQNFGRLTFD